MQEVDNISRILGETLIAIEEGNTSKIKQLSNQTIHSAAITQDPDNIIISVLVYSIAKIIDRKHYQEMPGWKPFYTSLKRNLNQAVKDLESNNLNSFRKTLGEIRNSINKISGNLRIYIQDVLRKAEINKAFKIYEHGLSSEQTAKLLGVSLWDLSTYIGQSSISEARVSETLPVKQRIKIAEEMFR